MPLARNLRTAVTNTGAALCAAFTFNAAAQPFPARGVQWGPPAQRHLLLQRTILVEALGGGKHVFQGRRGADAARA